MPETLTNIQDQVRHLARDDSIDLTTGTGLGVANRINRGMAALIQPTGLLTIDTSIITANGTETYTWPSVVYAAVLNVEIQDPNNSDKYKVIKPVPNEFRWTRAGAAADGFPWFYRRQVESGTKKIAFRPIPDFEKKVRITGPIEPTAFSEGSSTTPYLQFQMDDNLARLIAADYLFKRGQADTATDLLNKASAELSNLSAQEIKPEQLKELILNG